MSEKHVGQCFVLRAFHRLPSHSSVFQALIVFYTTVFKMEFFFFLPNIRNAVSMSSFTL